MTVNNNSSLPDHGWPLLDLVLWSSTFAILAIAIIVGNLLTIIVFTRKKVLRSRANYFLVSLAIADFLVGLVAIPMYLYTLVSYWKFGTRLHKVDFFHSYMAIDMFTGFASIFALTIIAIERLYAILWPFKHRIATKRMYHFLVSIAWVLSGSISIFYYLWSYQVLKYKLFFYLIIFFIFTSLTITWIAYSLIWIKLKVRLCKRRDSSCDSSVETLHASIRNHGSLRCQDHDVILTTLCIVTVMFVITWVPFYILNMVVFFRGGQKGIPEEAFYVSKLLHYGNSLVNPIVYSIKIPRFSRSVSLFFRRKRRAIAKSFRNKNISSKSSSSHRKTRSALTESTNI